MLYKYFVFAEIMAPVWFIFDYILFTGEQGRVEQFVPEDVGSLLYKCYTNILCLLR